MGGEFEKIQVTSFSRPTNKTTEWQEYAVRLCQDLRVPVKFRSRIFRVVKYYPRGQVESAKSFCLDYTGSVPKHMLFFWKLSEIDKKVAKS